MKDTKVEASTLSVVHKPVRKGAIRLPVELMERVRNAVYWTPGLTINRLAEIAFTNTLDCMEALHGGPFEPRKGGIISSKIK